MMIKICEICEKKFITRSSVKKFCSKDCSREASRRLTESREQICFHCKNAVSGCSWSREGKPIKNWKAMPSVIKDSEGDIHTYKIIFCPEYIRD